MTRLPLPALLLALALPTAHAATLFRADFAGGRLALGWEQHASAGCEIRLLDGAAELDADINAFAYLAHPLDRDNVTVEASLLASRPPGVSWCTSLFLFWRAGDWCQLGLVGEADGGHFYSTEMQAGVAWEVRLAPCDLSKWQHVRIELGKDCLRYYGSPDGETWQVLRVIERPEDYAGPPAYVAAGKGFSTGAALYAKPLLSNDYGDRGPRVVSKVGPIMCSETAPEHLALTPAERAQAAGAGRDPVAEVELQGREDPTFDRVARHFPPMRYPREAVGVPEHPDDIGIDYLGRLQLGNDIGAQDLPLLSFEVGASPGPLGGLPGGATRRLLEGWMPVVVLTASEGSVQYEQTALGWSEGFSADNELFALVRLTVRGQGALPDEITSVLTPAGERKRWTLRPRGSGAREVCLRVPFRRPAEAAEITGSEFETYVARTADFWQEQIAGTGAQITVPEQRVTEGYKAWLVYSMLNVDKIAGQYEPHDGAGFYEAIFGYSATLYCIALDQMGQHERAARYLGSLLSFQQPDGLYTQNFGLPDHGALLLALTEHYRLTQDAAWLRSVAPRIIAAGDWLVTTRAQAPTEGLARGLILFRPYCDYPEPTVDYFSDAYCCIGLEAAAKALAAIEMGEPAARFRQEARAYRADIMRSMQAAAFEHQGLTVLPLEPLTRRLLRASRYGGGDYYGLVASCLLESGFLPATDRRAHYITDLMDQRSGLLAGVCRFGPGGIDHAYTYGYLMTQLQRGETRQYLLGFYGMLAHGVTRDTYSGVECTTAVSGANAATLPHLYSCTQQLRTLRMMLLREEGSTLILCDALPGAWLADGQVVEVRGAPTYFGNVSFRLESRVAQGRLLVTVEPPTASPPRLIRLRLRHPAASPIATVTLNGAPWPHFSGDTVSLAPADGRMALVVSYGAR